MVFPSHSSSSLDSQVAAPAETRTPNLQRATIAQQGARGGLAEWEQFGKRRNK